MTCIVAVVEKDTMWMGGDSAGVDDGFGMQIRQEGKVFRLKDRFLLGGCGSFRMLNLLAYKFDPPPHDENDEDHEYMVVDFIEKLRPVFHDGGFTLKEDNLELIDGQFLVCYRKNIYVVEEDLHCGWIRNNFAAVGCGQDLALGSLYATQGKPARERVINALEAAEQFSAGVRRPWIIESMKVG